MAEPGDGGIAKAFYDNPSRPPNDTRPPPGEPVRRSSPAFGPEQGGASPKHFVGGVQSRDADRPPVRDRQNVTKPAHGGTAARSDPKGTGPRGRA